MDHVQKAGAIYALISSEIEDNEKFESTYEDGVFSISFPERPEFNDIDLEVIELDGDDLLGSNFAVHMGEVPQPFCTYDTSVKLFWQALLWQSPYNIKGVN